jgi:hypothetical protein
MKRRSGAGSRAPRPHKAASRKRRNVPKTMRDRAVSIAGQETDAARFILERDEALEREKPNSAAYSASTVKTFTRGRNSMSLWHWSRRKPGAVRLSQRPAAHSITLCGRNRCSVVPIMRLNLFAASQQCSAAHDQLFVCLCSGTTR